MTSEHVNSEVLSQYTEQAGSFEVGHEVTYGTRVYKIDAIHGDEAEITAPPKQHKKY
jgi:hypothetical protein